MPVTVTQVKKPDAKKPKAPVKPGAKAIKITRKVVYPLFEVVICTDQPTKEGCLKTPPLNMKAAKALMRWEDEEEFAQRLAREQPDTDPESWKYGDDFLLTDIEGKKVRCLHNVHNRPFDLPRAMQYAQDVLSRNWKLNGETIIISRTAEVESGQHRLIGVILACQLWAKDDHWKQLWPEEPTIECVLVRGASDDPAVVRTIDNVKPRTEADVFYTSDLFTEVEIKRNKQTGEDIEVPKYDANERKELTRMLAVAVDTLWRRTGMGLSEHHKYKTHSEEVAFRERHPKLVECVRHLFEENKERAVSINLEMSPGRCAALMYLMGACKSDLEKYQADDLPNESTLDWGKEDSKGEGATYQKARKFWTDLPAKHPHFGGITEAFNFLYGEDGKRIPAESEKIDTANIGWNAFIEGKDVTGENKKAVELLKVDEGDYVEKEGRVRYTGCVAVGGIDLGNPSKEDMSGDGVEVQEGDGVAAGEEEPEEKTKAEVEAEKKAAREARAKADEERAKLIEKRNKERKEAAKKGVGHLPPAQGLPARKPNAAEKAQTEKARKADEEAAKPSSAPPKKLKAK